MSETTGLRSPPQPVANDNRVQSDFLAANSRASQQQLDKEWQSFLAPQKQDAQPTQPAIPATPTKYIDPNVPFGVQVDNYASNFTRAARNTMAGALGEAMPSAAGAVGDMASSAWARYKGGIEGSWDKLKSDYIAAHNIDPNSAKLPLWDQIKQQFNLTVAAGKLYPDAFNLVMSPISSAIGVATHGAAVAAHEATGGESRQHMSVQDFEDAFNTAMMGIAPAKGGLGAAMGAKEAAGVTGAETAAEAPKVAPGPPTVAPGPNATVFPGEHTSSGFTGLEDRPMWFSKAGGERFGGLGYNDKGEPITQLVRGNVDLKNPFVESAATPNDWDALTEKLKENGVPRDTIDQFSKDAPHEFGAHMEPWLQKGLEDLGYDGVIADKSWRTPWAISFKPKGQVSISSIDRLDDVVRKEQPYDLGADKHFEPTEEDRASAASFLNGEQSDNPVHVAMQKLIDPATRNEAVNEIAKIIPLDKVKPVDVTQMNAYSLQLSPDEVMAQIRPQFPDDETMYAAGMVLNSAAKQAWEMARTFAESGMPEDYERAVRGYSIANKYLGDLRSAKTDWGRAGRIQQELTTDFSHYTRAIQATIDNVGSDNMEEAIRKIGSLDDPAKVPGMLSSMRTMTGRDGILYAWYNLLLSNPRTIIKKLNSDAIMATWNVAARYAAEKAGSGGVPAGETAQLIYGYTSNMGDAIRAAGKALKTGGSQFEPHYQTVEGTNKFRLSQLANGIDPSPANAEAVTPSVVNYLRSALPTSWIGAADDFAKTLNYGAERRALAFRQATEEAVQNEAINPYERMNELMNNLPDSIHEQAVAAALRNTFQEPLTGIASKVQDTMDGFNIPVGSKGFEIPVGRIVMPFVRIPANIAKFAYRNSPLPLAFPTQAYIDELRSGGARAAVARARVGLGTGITLIGTSLAINGTLTGRGPSDPQLRRAWLDAGNQPYSIKVGGTWYGYRGTEPIGLIMGAIADTVDLMKFSKEQDSEQMATSLIFGTGNAMLNASYLSGTAEFLDALQQPDQDGQFYARNLIASMATPQGLAGMASAIDPWRRVHQDLLTTIESRLPFISQGLPPQRTLWGDPIPLSDGFMPPISGTGAARMLSPIPMKGDQAEPIDKWIWDNRTAFPRADKNQLGLTKVPRVIAWNNGKGATGQAELTDAQYDRYQVLAGNELKDGRTGLGAKDYLNALVQNSSPDRGVQLQWNNSTPAAQALMVQTIYNKFKQGAKEKIVADNQDVQDAIQASLQARVQTLTGTQ